VSVYFYVFSFNLNPNFALNVQISLHIEPTKEVAHLIFFSLNIREKND
jgi:hypothetical protein